MGSQAGRCLDGLRAGPSRVVELAGLQVRVNRGVEYLGGDIGIRQPREERDHLVHHGAGPAEVLGPEGYPGHHDQRRAAKLSHSQAFGDRQG